MGNKTHKSLKFDSLEQEVYLNLWRTYDRLRAIEEGMPVVRSTPTGISAVIDSNGAVLVALPMGKAGFIQTSLPNVAPPTLFARFGNILPFGFALTLIGFAVALRRRQR